MNEIVKLKAEDGFELDAYVAKPEGEPIAGLVVIQEIFGVNAHIRSVADGYAKDGFLVVAPAIFDRVGKGIELSYDEENGKKGYAIMGDIGLVKMLEDVAAAIEYTRTETSKKVGTVGYCLGGLLSYLSACRLTPDASVGYYAGSIGKFAEETPKVPMMLHFGKKDAHIGADQVEKVQAAHPEVQIFWYENAGHAFNRDVDAGSYDAASAKLARERSLEFLKKNLA